MNLKQRRQQAEAAKEAYDACYADTGYATKAHKSIAGEFMNHWDDPDWALLVLDALDAVVKMHPHVEHHCERTYAHRDHAACKYCAYRREFDAALKKLETS